MKLNLLTTVTLSAALLISACQQQKPKETKATEPAIDPKVAVTCDGIGEVKLTDTYADLEKRFGAKSLSAHTNSVRGSFTAIWDQQPNQINVYWKEKSAPFTHIVAIETASPDGPYEAKGGLRPGMTMKEVQAINSGMPLTFENPFADDDMAGLISTFNNGQISKDNPCLSGYVEVTKTRNIDQATIDEFKKNEKTVDGTHQLFQERVTVVFSRFKVAAK